MPVKEIADRKFDVTPNEPFGERWIPIEGAVPIDNWVLADIGEVVEEVRRAGLVIIEDSIIGGGWDVVGIEDSLTVVPHTDKGEPVAVHMLHAEGERSPTAYAKSVDLSVTVRANIDMLREISADAPEATRQSFMIDLLLESYLMDEDLIYFSHTIDSLLMMQAKIGRMRDQLYVGLCIAGQDLKQVEEEYEMLTKLFASLRRFYLKIASDTVKCVHNWSEYPSSTALSYQYPLEELRNPKSTVFHFRFPEDIVPNESFLNRNYVLRTESRRRTDLILSSDQRTSMQRWF